MPLDSGLLFWVTLYIPASRPGERCKFPQRDLERSLADTGFGEILTQNMAYDDSNYDDIDAVLRKNYDSILYRSHVE